MSTFACFFFPSLILFLFVVVVVVTCMLLSHLVRRERERKRERENYIYSECGSTGKTGAGTAHAPPGLWAFPARRPSGDPVGLSKYSLRVDGLLITTSASSPTCSLVPVSSLVLSYSSRCFPTPPSSSKCDTEAQLGFSSL